MIAQDEENIIEYSVTNPLLIADKVVVVDGGSKDRTKEIIQQTAKRLNMFHKLFLYDKPFTTLNDQRNFALSKCKDCDFIMYMDSDELMHPWELKKIRDEYINQYDLILIKSLHLYLDFWHEARSQGFLNSYKMPRVFKNIYGLHYSKYVPHIGDHTIYIDNVYFMDYFKKQRLCEYTDITIKHYGHCLSREHEKNKIIWFMKYDSPDLRKKSDEELEKMALNSSYFDSRFWEHHQNADPKTIIKFTGEHPEVIKSHPLYNIKIIND
jgi:glycosyltransferase involved in cell wall biosynthesis